jgi:hypothetical protein
MMMIVSARSIAAAITTTTITVDQGHSTECAVCRFELISQPPRPGILHLLLARNVFFF